MFLERCGLFINNNNELEVDSDEIAGPGLNVFSHLPLSVAEALPTLVGGAGSSELVLIAKIPRHPADMGEKEINNPGQVWEGSFVAVRCGPGGHDSAQRARRDAPSPGR